MDFQSFQSATFSSQRLSFSLYRSSDLNDVYSLLSIPEVSRYNTIEVMSSKNDTENYMEKAVQAHLADNISSFAIVFRLKENGQFVGLAGLQLQRPVYRAAEVWYKLMPELWGKGYATEVLKWQLQFAFTHLNLHRVTAGCAVQNTASFIVMEKAGMRREGICIKALPLKDGWADTVEYAMLEKEYFKKNR